MIEKLAATILIILALTWVVAMSSLCTNNERFIDFMSKFFIVQIVIDCLLGSIWLMYYIWN